MRIKHNKRNNLKQGQQAQFETQGTYPSGAMYQPSQRGYYNQDDSSARGYYQPQVQVQVREIPQSERGYYNQPTQRGFNQPAQGSNTYYQPSQGSGSYYQPQPVGNREFASQTTTVASDREIAKNVEDNLKPGWISSGYETVSFDVVDGNVTLRGTVETLRDKEKIEKNVREINGVRNINNQIRVTNQKSSFGVNDPSQRGQVNSDREIAKNVEDNLKPGWISAGYETVSFDVVNGNVTLRGSVETLRDKEKIEKNVRDINGVRNINNQIRVTNLKPSLSLNDSSHRGFSNQSSGTSYYQPQVPADNRDYASQNKSSNASDREIAKNVEDNLKPGWISAGFETVSFDVFNGNVTLRGTVETLKDKEKIERNIRDISGVRNINNQIKVTNQRPLALGNSMTSTKSSAKAPDTFETESDRQLNTKIHSTLDNSPVATKSRNIILFTKNGIVTISGTVNKMDDIKEIVLEVKKVNGVKEVRNQLSAQGH